jgi:hypothetical protein
MPQSPCLGGTSDDGVGNFALGYLANSTPGGAFFTLRDGKAVEIGERHAGPDHGYYELFSQPSGFTKFVSDDSTRQYSLSSYSHGGGLTSVDTFPYTGSVRVAVDPVGGTAVVRSLLEPSTGYGAVTFKRYDKTGKAETDWVSIGTSLRASAVGMNLAGHVLVHAYGASTRGASGASFVRWFSRNGSPLTDWTEMPQLIVDHLEFLMDDSIVFGHFGGRDGRFEDLGSTVSPLPDWLAQRKGSRLAVIRNGKGYASWGLTSKCGQLLEVLTSGGTSCGCVAIPDLTPWATVQSFASIGRDGSLIVPAPAGRACAYDLYPQLLK